MRKARYTIGRFRTYGLLAFGAIMVLGCLVGMLFFARPASSAIENRNLTAFPEATADCLRDGSFFTGLSLWYADTYPLREPMIAANKVLGGLFGVEPSTRLIGGNRASDAIPDGDVSEGDKPTHRHDVEIPENSDVAANIEKDMLNGAYVQDDACYMLYYFDEKGANAYAGVINDAADLLGDDVNVYSILVPTSGGVMLDETTLGELGCPDQGQAIDYLYSLMVDRVQTVSMYDVLREHNSEYLYYRTDMHWTQAASVYAYESFCELKGIEPSKVNSWDTMTFDGFMGEFAVMADLWDLTPDTVTAHVPPVDATVTYWTDDLDPSTKTLSTVVVDQTDAVTYDKYDCFAGGNLPLVVIENPDLDDGSSCLVVKDSFGNAFVADMVENYQHIYTVDFRWTHQKMLDMVKKYDIKDVIFINNMGLAGNVDTANLISAIVYPDSETAGTSDGAADVGSDSSSGSAADGGGGASGEGGTGNAR